MKTYSLAIINLLILVISMNSCIGQSEKNYLNPIIGQKATSIDTLNKPKINIKVNKEFDSKGNLTRYDSTYSYVFRGSNISIHDSLFPFKSFLGKHVGDLFNNRKDFFIGDSLFNKNFFEDDFFKKQLELNRLLFDGFYPKKDSLKSNYLNGPYIRPSNKTI